METAPPCDSYSFCCGDQDENDASDDLLQEILTTAACRPNRPLAVPYSLMFDEITEDAFDALYIDWRRTGVRIVTCMAGIHLLGVY